MSNKDKTISATITKAVGGWTVLEQYISYTIAAGWTEHDRTHVVTETADLFTLLEKMWPNREEEGR